jgi:hypothetical protein
MSKYGILLNQSSFTYLDPTELPYIPRGSVVIVASGLLPVYMLQNTTYQAGGATLTQLLDKGDTIIYIGDNFSTTIGEQ